MQWRVDVCRLILGMLCIMGGKGVCCILGICTVCTVGSREQRMHDIL